MTLNEIQAANRERMRREPTRDYDPDPVIEKITASTWEAATQAERERVRALVEKVRAGKDSHAEPDEVDITLDELIKEL